MENKLYPLKFTPILKPRIWGGQKLHTVLGKKMEASSVIGESWELSGVQGDVSIVSNGFLKGNTLNELLEVYMADLVGDKVFEKFGDEFPLLIKFIDARDVLSIQVHPDDALAKERHQSFGKTEMWYVMQADKGASLISGFKQDTTKDAYVKALKNNELENLLARHEVKTGDVFYIPAGRVHAIGAGILLAEIQQTSDVTYRLYDFDRRDAEGNTRELHTEQALDAIDFSGGHDYKTSYSVPASGVAEIVNTPFFVTNVIKLTNQEINSDFYAFDSFVILICVEGSAEIEYSQGKKETLSLGETILLPADLKEVSLTSPQNATLLQVHM